MPIRFFIFNQKITLSGKNKQLHSNRVRLSPLLAPRILMTPLSSNLMSPGYWGRCCRLQRLKKMNWIHKKILQGQILPTACVQDSQDATVFWHDAPRILGSILPFSTAKKFKLDSPILCLTLKPHKSQFYMAQDSQTCHWRIKYNLFSSQW